MSMTTFIEKLAGMQRKRERTQAQKYCEIVATMAMGKEPDATEVDRVLQESNKSLDDLQADVENAERRMMLHLLSNSLPKFQMERDEVEKAIKSLDAEFEKVEREHDEARFELENTLRKCIDAVREATSARAELVNTCTDETLLAERNHIDSELRRVTELNRELVSKATYLEDKAETELLMADREVNTSDRDHRRSKSESYKKQAESIRNQIKANNKLSENLESQRVEIETRMIDS